MKTSKSSEALTQFGAENIAFPPKHDIRTDGHTDISNYRVASLLKRLIRKIFAYGHFTKVHIVATVFTVYLTVTETT